MPEPYPQPPYYAPHPQHGPLPPLAPPPTRDDGDLRILSILEYVYAGFLALTGLVCGLYIGVGIFIARTPFPVPRGRAGAPPSIDMEMIGGIVILVGVIAMFIAFAKSVLLIVSARSMNARKRHTLCIVAAALTCISFPLGTALGVFTLIVLLRPSVRALFT
jgi:hypothetical protein